jgi:hypothetical protein
MDKYSDPTIPGGSHFLFCPFDARRAGFWPEVTNLYQEDSKDKAIRPDHDFILALTPRKPIC